jgi:hypothetical protein
VRERFLHIRGEWRDHRTFALTAEEVPDGLLTRWLAASAGPAGPDAPAGGTGVIPDEQVRAADRQQATAESIRQWLAGVDAVVTALGSTGPRAKAAIKAFGGQGLGILLLTAAAGSFDADRLLGRVLGDTDAVHTLRDDLADRAVAAVSAEHDAFLRQLDDPAFADDASTSLRVRLGELRRLT